MGQEAWRWEEAGPFARRSVLPSCQAPVLLLSALPRLRPLAGLGSPSPRPRAAPAGCSGPDLPPQEGSGRPREGVAVMKNQSS